MADSQADDVPQEVDNLEADFSVEDTKQAQGVQEVHVEGMGLATAELIDFGYIDYYRKRNAVSDRTDSEQAEGEAEITPEQMAEIFADRYASPDFSGLTGDDVREMRPLAPSRLLEALMGEGVEVSPNADGSVNVAESDGESAGN